MGIVMCLIYRYYNSCLLTVGSRLLEKCLKCEITSRHFHPGAGEGPSRETIENETRLQRHGRVNGPGQCPQSGQVRRRNKKPAAGDI